VASRVIGTPRCAYVAGGVMSVDGQLFAELPPVACWRLRGAYHGFAHLTDYAGTYVRISTDGAGSWMVDGSRAPSWPAASTWTWRRRSLPTPCQCIASPSASASKGRVPPPMSAPSVWRWNGSELAIRGHRSRRVLPAAGLPRRHRLHAATPHITMVGLRHTPRCDVPGRPARTSGSGRGTDEESHGALAVCRSGHIRGR
jgi:hypothetical protein